MLTIYEGCTDDEAGLQHGEWDLWVKTMRGGAEITVMP